MSKEMDLIDVFSDIYKHKKAVALAIVLATLSSFTFTSVRPVIYEVGLSVSKMPSIYFTDLTSQHWYTRRSDLNLVEDKGNHTIVTSRDPASEIFQLARYKLSHPSVLQNNLPIISANDSSSVSNILSSNINVSENAGTLRITTKTADPQLALKMLEELLLVVDEKVKSEYRLILGSLLTQYSQQQAALYEVLQEEVVSQQNAPGGQEDYTKQPDSFENFYQNTAFVKELTYRAATISANQKYLSNPDELFIFSNNLRFLKLDEKNKFERRLTASPWTMNLFVGFIGGLIGCGIAVLLGALNRISENKV